MRLVLLCLQPTIEARREEMCREGWQRHPPPLLTASLPLSLVPKESWVMPRTGGKSSIADKHWLCHLCSEAELITYDRGNSVFKPIRGSGPPGFNSRPMLESHMRMRHCIQLHECGTRRVLFRGAGPPIAPGSPLRPEAVYLVGKGRGRKAGFVKWEGLPEEEGTYATPAQCSHDT